jgi:hypothetical protein
MLGTVSSAIFAAAALGEEDTIGESLRPKITLIVDGGGLDDDGRNLVCLTGHCLGGRNGVVSNKWRSKS